MAEMCYLFYCYCFYCYYKALFVHSFSYLLCVH